MRQSLEVIFTTRQGERVMREWFGNPGLKLLGENATPQTILLWFTTLWVLTELFEPRFRISRFVVNDVTRLGFSDFTIEGEHRPYAHLDWVQAQYYVSVTDGAVSLSSVA
ncbi:GPW/gp25 family protein [Hoeflea sp.]|uniref:GPW/gp25 family protein n=1 Tax=Hoeflea sp. TaxID=1940281 RepID=UPI003B51D76C